jgi:hypothetical protein
MSNRIYGPGDAIYDPDEGWMEIVDDYHGVRRTKIVDDYDPPEPTDFLGRDIRNVGRSGSPTRDVFDYRGALRREFERNPPPKREIAPDMYSQVLTPEEAQGKFLIWRDGGPVWRDQKELNAAARVPILPDGIDVRRATTQSVLNPFDAEPTKPVSEIEARFAALDLDEDDSK